MLRCILFQLRSRRLKLRHGADVSGADHHTQSCVRCRLAADSDHLSRQLLDGLKEVEVPLTSPDFYTGIQLRIRIMQAESRAGSQALTDWEGVILQFQRLILSGAATAALCIGLLAYSQSAPSTVQGNRESGLESYVSPTQGDRLLITRTDPISQDDVLFALVTEDSDNARQ